MSKRKRVGAQGTPREGHPWAPIPSSTSEKRELLEEKLLSSLVWDETKFEYNGVIRVEQVEELISI